MSGLGVRGVSGIGEVEPGTALGELVAESATPRPGEIVAVAQKIVSKAEGRRVILERVEPGPRALELAATLGKDPRVVEAVLGETRRIVRAERGVLIVETHSGLVCANAGVDTSNTGNDGQALLLPEDPDRSARRIRAELAARGADPVGVVICDSFGRPWRQGQTDVAIGCAGIEPIDDWRGRLDRDRRELRATAIAVADCLAGVAGLCFGKDAGVPVAVISGAERYLTEDGCDGPGAVALRRSAREDLFR